MLVDAYTLPADQVIETDVCIVGAGPAGITLALEFAGRDFQVCILESGELELNEEIQSLCEGEILSKDHYPSDELEAGRCRQFGGAANRWHIQIGGDRIGVRHAPLDDIDFEKRDWLPYSGWPFDRTHLVPFYERAHAICQLGPFTYEAKDWADAQTPPLSFKGDRLLTTIFQFGPRDIFPREYRDQINRANNITTYLNANVVEIETNETASSVTRLQVASLDGKKFWVSAKKFILATGGIENARLLLLSDKTQKTGLANQNDLVGRFYMDHPGFSIGAFIPRDRKILNSTALYDLRSVKNVPVAGKLSLTEAVMQREKMLNTSIWLFPRPIGHNSKAVSSLKTLLSSLRQAKLPKDASKHWSNVVVGLDEIADSAYRSVFKKQPLIVDAGRGGWSFDPKKEQKYGLFEIAIQVEQAPDPDNRVVLSEKRDRLGLRKAQLHWSWSDIDLHSIKRTQEILREEIAGAELGEFKYGSLEETLSKLYSAHHHIGTTRMHIDPKQGIVDENCQAHGIPNLFIIGSSVFPTGGYTNPTLTIVALSIRLADHMKSLM